MKRAFLTLVVAMFCLNIIYAQTKTPQQKAREVADKIVTVCKLKPEQAVKIQDAYLQYYTKHDALKKQKDILNKSTYDDRKSDLKKTRDAVVKSTLTASQYKQWTTAKNKAKEEQKKEEKDE